MSNNYMKPNQLKIAVVGLGSIGLPLLEVLADKHFVVGVDLNTKLKTRFLTYKKIPKGMDVVIICTPERAVPDLVYLADLYNTPNIIIRSTMPIGSSSKLLGRLHNSRLFYAPERSLEGKIKEEIDKIPQLVAGHDKDAVNFLLSIFFKAPGIIYKDNFLEVEAAKLISNAYRYLQFTTSNILYNACSKHNLDFYAVNDLAAQGYNRMGQLSSAGYVGGPCLPKDLEHLLGSQDSLKDSLFEVNKQLTKNVVNKAMSQLKENKLVGIYGLTMKKDSPDTRGAWATVLEKELLGRNENITIVKYDPFLHHQEGLSLIEQCDVVIIATPHSQASELNHTNIIDVWSFK